MKTTWRKLIDKERGDETLIACTLDDEKMDAEFDDTKGEGAPFTAWTKRRVLFPVEYDGMVAAASVPRHPCPEATEHMGGG